MDYNQAVKVVETKRTSKGKNISRLIQRFNCNEQLVQELLYCYDFKDGAEFLKEKSELQYNDVGQIKYKYQFTGHRPSDTGFGARDLEEMITYEYDANGRVIKTYEEGDDDLTEGRSRHITIFQYSEDGTKIGKRYRVTTYDDSLGCNYITEHYDRAGHLICEDRGTFKKYWDYDDNGNLILEHWVSNQPDSKSRFKPGVDTPMHRYEYDERGNRIASFHFEGPMGKISWEDHAVFDEQNQIIESSMIYHEAPERNSTATYEYEVTVHDIIPDEIIECVLDRDDRIPRSCQVLLQRANGGDIIAIVDAAENYYNGDNGFPEDNELAFKWCKKGLEIDVHNVELWVQLARCHEKAGTDADKGAAHRAYRCAAELGHVPSMYIIAEDLYNEQDESKRAECLPWLEKAVADQDEIAEALLGYIYLKGDLQTKNPQRGIDLLTRSAEHGDFQGARILANAYLHQIDGCEEIVPFSTSQAAKYFAIAVENGEDSHKALYYAGLAYFYGEGVPKSMEKARKCIEALIDDAYVPSEKVFDLLGCMCFEGAGGPVDFKLGEKALRRAIKSDDAEVSSEAMNNLGVYFYTQANRLSEAIQLLQNAANQGNANAQVNLGKAYYEGKGIPQNKETAAYYFGLAAKQGNQTAIENLQVMGTSNSVTAYNEPATQEKRRHPIRGAIIGYFAGGFLGAILHLFWPGAEWITAILGAILGALKG